MPSGVLLTSRAIASNPSNGKIYAVDENHASISVIESAGNSPISVRVGAGPDALAVNTVTGNVYVANSTDGTVSVISGETNAVTATLRAGPHPYTLAVNEVTNKIYVTNTFSDAVAVINGSTNTTSFLKMGSADNVAVDQRANRVFFIGYEDPNVRILNGTTDLVEKTPAQEHLWGMGVNELTGEIFVTGAGSADILDIDPNLSQVKRISVGVIPCALAVNAKNNTIYVVNYADSTVTVVDTEKGHVVTTIRVGKGPQAIAVDPRVNRVYVANTHENSVTVIDDQRNIAIGTIPAGKNPFAITVSSNPRVIYVANLGEPSFTAVKIETK
jgi:YVTN family beta-propeller protein